MKHLEKELQDAAVEENVSQKLKVVSETVAGHRNYWLAFYMNIPQIFFV